MDTTTKSEKVINICTPNWDPYDSMGVMATNVAWQLHQLGYHINAIGLGDQDQIYENSSLPEPMVEILSKPIKMSVGGIMFGYPTIYDKYGILGLEKAIGVVMFESTKIPPDWVEPLNRVRHLVYPTDWNQEVFSSCGVTTDSSIQPLGINRLFTYVDRGTRKPNVKRPFTFLTIGDRLTRKGWLLSVKAFVEAFGKDPRYRLIIKTRTGLPVHIDYPNIEVIKGDYSTLEMQDLFANVDAFLWPSYGEGFGLWPREAAATGLPVISNTFSGSGHAIMKWGYPVKWDPVEPWDYHPEFRELDLGVWGEARLDDLIKQMKYVTSGNPYIWYMAKRSSENVKELYRWDRFAKHLLSIYEGDQTNANHYI